MVETEFSYREIQSAIDAFVKEPSDSNAQDIHLASLFPASITFFSRDREKPDKALIELLERGRDALLQTTLQTDLTRHYAKTMRWRVDLLLAVNNADEHQIRSLLQEGIEAER